MLSGYFTNVSLFIVSYPRIHHTIYMLRWFLFRPSIPELVPVPFSAGECSKVYFSMDLADMTRFRRTQWNLILAQ